MEEPGKEVVERISAEFSARVVKQITVDSAGDVLHFVVTGPNKAEYKKFSDEILKAGESKADSDRIEKMGAATDKFCLAMIRWPDRAMVVEIFDNRPALSGSLAEYIQKLAGTGSEVREKK